MHPTGKEPKYNGEVSEDTGALIAVIAKRMGFSFDELNEMNIQSLIDIANLYTEKTEDKDRPKEATQADIDAWCGWMPKKAVTDG